MAFFIVSRQGKSKKAGEIEQKNPIFRAFFSLTFSCVFGRFMPRGFTNTKNIIGQEIAISRQKRPPDLHYFVFLAP
jgi:hypothetical protein